MGKKLNTDNFIEKAKALHGEKYDYSKVEYKGSNKYVVIICPIHGEFKQRACSQLLYEKQIERDERKMHLCKKK